MSQQSVDPTFDIAKSGRVEHLFTTPIFWHVLKDAEALNAALCDLILEQERAAVTVVKSNQGGWQSPSDFFGWGGSPVATLERYASQAVEIATARVLVKENVKIEFQLVGWAAVNRRGHYNTPHVHPMATWSGVTTWIPGTRVRTRQAPSSSSRIRSWPR